MLFFHNRTHNTKDTLPQMRSSKTSGRFSQSFQRRKRKISWVSEGRNTQVVHRTVCQSRPLRNVSVLVQLFSQEPTDFPEDVIPNCVWRSHVRTRHTRMNITHSLKPALRGCSSPTTAASTCFATNCYMPSPTVMCSGNGKRLLEWEVVYCCLLFHRYTRALLRFMLFNCNLFNLML